LPTHHYLFGRPCLSHILYTLAVSSSSITSYVQIGTNWCKDSGIYEFTMGSTGAKVKARYTFVYVYEDGQWKIAHHHSSQMPEAIQPKQPVLNDREVRGLFNVSVWKEACEIGIDSCTDVSSSTPIVAME
jgi:SnoaL-like domain